MEIVLYILVYIVFLLLPAAGILSYYKHWDIMFYISSIVCAILWIISILHSYSTAWVFGLAVLLIPLILAFFLKQADGYNYFLFASCFGAYLTFLYIYLYGKALGHWSI